MNPTNRKNIVFKTLIETLKTNSLLKYGCLILTFILIIVAFAPIFATHNPYELDGELLTPPSKEHWLGTDGLGRDVYSMLVYGARTSLLIGIVSALISGIIGTVIGGIAGYFGGKVDRIISEIINIFLMIPTFFLILIIVALFGSSLVNVMIVIGLTSWPSNARLMRVQAMSLKKRVFVKSVEAMGESHGTILFRYIIPNGIFPVIANTTLSVAGAILTEAGLSFLGLGDPNLISWGQMIFEGKSYMTSAWWISTFSGLATVILVVSFYLIGDGLNTILNPKLKVRK
ncbi:ABC transporter permease [Cytobacillus dafuensis]|uniref:ABC transporter permease n=1 Tax=Cytobacillus dafuensis TaxID=1742359 RepID=A0A5B8Z7H7_CYTDA|nr:ABC transporter permease [Cytobacillus dafuensis]QED49112.1 ABC transporter permease [Cytobacillus dafuensis]